MVNHICLFFKNHLFNILDVIIKIKIIPYAQFIINLCKVYKDQNEYCVIPTSNVLGLTSFQNF